MAKSIGNGYPLAAVVTTPGKVDCGTFGTCDWMVSSNQWRCFLLEIAKVMANAIHFNTFGGNALGSAVGMAVLDVSVTVVFTTAVID